MASRGNGDAPVKPPAPGYPSVTTSTPSLIPSDTFVKYTVAQGESNPPRYTLHLTNRSDVPVTITLSVPNEPAWLNTGYNTQPMTLSPGGVAGVGVSIISSLIKSLR